MRKFAGFVAGLMFAGVSYAAQPETIISVGYLTGSGDLTGSGGVNESVDIDGYGVEATFYVSDNIALGVRAQKQNSDYTLSNVKREQETDVRAFGLSYVFGGRVDTWLGEGIENQLRLSYADLDTTVKASGSSTDSSSDTTAIGFTHMRGLGDGVVVSGAISVDSEELLDDWAINVNLSKALTERVAVVGSYEFGDAKETDATYGFDYSAFLIALQLSF